MANPWFKFYGPEYISDQKFLGMDGNARSCWLTLLCYASEHCGEVRYLSEDQLMVMAGVPMGGDEWRKTQGVLKRFVEKGMIDIEENLIRISNWDKRQTLSQYERVKRHREKMKNDNENDNAVITADKNREDKNREDKNREEENRLAFDRVWSVYPKKVGKAEAFKAFKRLGAEETLVGQIISSIALWEQTSQWQDNNRRYVPYLATYLNQRRFEDEVSQDALPKVVKL